MLAMKEQQRLKQKVALTLVVGNIARGPELLNGYMRVAREQDGVPIIVPHHWSTKGTRCRSKG